MATSCWPKVHLQQMQEKENQALKICTKRYLFHLPNLNLSPTTMQIIEHGFPKINDNAFFFQKFFIFQNFQNFLFKQMVFCKIIELFPWTCNMCPFSYLRVRRMHLGHHLNKSFLSRIEIRAYTFVQNILDYKKNLINDRQIMLLEHHLIET